MKTKEVSSRITFPENVTTKQLNAAADAIGANDAPVMKFAQREVCNNPGLCAGAFPNREVARIIGASIDMETGGNSIILEGPITTMEVMFNDGEPCGSNVVVCRFDKSDKPYFSYI